MHFTATLAVLAFAVSVSANCHQRQGEDCALWKRSLGLTSKPRAVLNVIRGIDVDIDSPIDFNADVDEVDGETRVEVGAKVEE